MPQCCRKFASRQAKTAGRPFETDQCTYAGVSNSTPQLGQAQKIPARGRPVMNNFAGDGQVHYRFPAQASSIGQSGEDAHSKVQPIRGRVADALGHQAFGSRPRTGRRGWPVVGDPCGCLLSSPLQRQVVFNRSRVAQIMETEKEKYKAHGRCTVSCSLAPCGRAASMCLALACQIKLLDTFEQLSVGADLVEPQLPPPLATAMCLQGCFPVKHRQSNAKFASCLRVLRFRIDQADRQILT